MGRRATGFIQHAQSVIGTQPAANIATLHVLAHSTVLAGSGMSVDRMEEDRETEVANGKTLGRITVDMGFRPASDSAGYYEYGVIKYERSNSVPAIGTDPVPSSADITSKGMQSSVRSLSPGYLIQYGIIPVTAETTRTKKLIINFAKFKKALVRDGDYFVLIVFNKTGSATSIYDLYWRFKTMLK